MCAIEALDLVSTDVAETPRQLQKAVMRQSQQQQRAAKVFASVEEVLMVRLGSRMNLQERAGLLLVDWAVAPCESGFAWRSDRRATFPSPVCFSED